MESEPNRFDDFLKRQRELSPPPRIAENLERKVMSRLLRSPPNRRTAFRWAWISLAASLAILFNVLVLRNKPVTQLPEKNLAFEESVVLLDDNLICIWLEPLDPTPGETRP